MNLLHKEYCNGELQSVHNFVESLLRDLVLYEIVPFLDEDEQSIITIDFETSLIDLDEDCTLSKAKVSFVLDTTMTESSADDDEEWK